MTKPIHVGKLDGMKAGQWTLRNPKQQLEKAGDAKKELQLGVPAELSRNRVSV